MNTKSSIQLMIESINTRNDIKEGICNLMDKYNIKDNIFVYNNGLKEATQGYFSIMKESDNLIDILDSYMVESKNNICGIRVVNNEMFQLGRIHKSIIECDRDCNILDIDLKKDVR